MNQQQTQKTKANQQQARRQWDIVFPSSVRENFIKFGTAPNSIQKNPFVFPVTLVAISKNGQFAVFRQDNSNAPEIPVCVLHETAIAFPICLFLAGSSSPEILLEAEIGVRGNAPSNYRLVP